QFSLAGMSNSKEKDEYILKKLEWFFNGGYKETDIRMLPDNYFFIEEILKLDEFAGVSISEVHNAVHSDGKLRFSVRGAKIRLKPPELNKDRDVIISKKLAWILRHGAEKEGFKFADGGYLHLDEMLAHSEFADVNVDDIRRVIDANDKKRFELRSDPSTGRLQVRATQGHSMKVEGIEYTDVNLANAHQFPVVIHGTYLKNWRQISQEGLKTMGRTHIHFAPGEIGEDGVVSGMRGSAEILIYLDLEMALRDGIKFVLSKNKVILSEGDATGTIAPKYFKEVYQRRPRVLIQRRDE
ncbi:hypothetical protein BOX15_Mlig027782g1, partial [Macrostomum lignano]